MKKTVNISYSLFLVLFLSTIFILIGERTDLLFWLCLEVISAYLIANLFGHVVRNIVWFIYCLMLGGQVTSVLSSGYYIIPLTLSNVSEFSSLGIATVVKLSLVEIAFMISSLLIYKDGEKFCSSEKYIKTILMLPFLFTVVVTPSPLHALSTTMISYFRQLTYTPLYNYPDFARKYFKVGIWNDEKKEIFSLGEKKNIIVIFTEGMSSAVIDRVNNLNLGVTPNLDILYDKSIVFNNYYNHTAATFRGLRGQLTSAYQYKDGIGANHDGLAEITNDTVRHTYQNRLVSLPEILNKHGYETYFLSSTERESTLNTMLKTMAFTAVYGMGDYDFYQEDRMTDKQTFAALKQILLQHDGSKKPLFIGVYPSGTHHGRDSPDLKFKDGSNLYYNKFFNFDSQLANFINFFNNSSYIKNTVIIITSDHSTYPTPEFKKSFNVNANYFVDQIPLIIYNLSKGHFNINANGNNSLSLTPTILQLLRINNEPNYFLGCSLFDSTCESNFSKISAIGDSYYETYEETFPIYGVKEIQTNDLIHEFYNVSG